MEDSREKWLKRSLGLMVFGLVLFAVLCVWALSSENWAGAFSAAVSFALCVVHLVWDAMALAKEKKRESN